MLKDWKAEQTQILSQLVTDVNQLKLTDTKTLNRELRVEDKLNTKSIGLPGDRKPIFVDESLKRLSHQAREFAKRNNYKFCWISNSKILLRKNSETKVIHTITSEPCFLKLEQEK